MILSGLAEAGVALAHAYSAIGKKAESEKALRDLERKLKGASASPYRMAAIYAGLGENDKAFEFQGMNQLPEGCRMAFILHEVEGHEHHDTARLLSCSIGNSKPQLHRARRKLRGFLLKTRAKRFAEARVDTLRK